MAEDNVKGMYDKARAAFKIVEFWPQDKVDDMVLAVGWELQKKETAEELARLAVESGLGVYEDKVHKIGTKVRGTLYDQIGVKTCGLVEEDKAKGIRRYAKPIGVIANVVPCTNPESTVCCIALSTLKTRNAIICSPHPRTELATYTTVEHIRKALAKVGAPVDLVQCIRHTSNEKTQELMANCDYAVATGGAALVKVVYAAGVPAQTVGAGNVVSIVDATVKDIPTMAARLVKSKTANNAASCSSENAVAIEEKVFDKVVAQLKAEGGYLCSTEEREILRKTMWPDGHTLNREIVAKNAVFIAQLAGLKVPAGTRVLMVMGEKIGREDRFSGEKLSPVLTVWKWTDFDEMLDRLEKILRFSGEGHSVNIQTEIDERRVKLALRANVGRVVSNMGHTEANSGGWTSHLGFTDTLGCGTWAGNISCENINWKQFLMYTRLAVPVENYQPSDDVLFGPYLKKYGRD
ncbi:MAG: Sulfoacetaldehyde dehydrogenase (acylating) [Syntrophaceae bacterium PtaU1.Bin231]|nr:MAG: Sulfoacetaldehyde dehydrogenase (acylating) [Syntrophaceae bacterium PtaU1.Bin231]HOG17854.1 aldehyde dehydrogenase family protein [Syntrophales bacterium]